MRAVCHPLWLAAVLVAAALPAQERAGSVRGVVRDKEFDAPIAGAVVTLVENGRQATTAPEGNFLIGDVPAGKYTVVIKKDGYVQQVKADVLVTAGKLTELDLALSGDYTEMEEFVVQDTLQLGNSSEAGLLQLRLESPSMMDSIGSDLMSKAGVSDAAGALKLVAGASVQNGKSAVIRGLPDRYVSSQINGVRLPSADEDKRAVELDQFPAAAIDSIQVSKTFTPDQQGDASGGAVDLRLKGIPDEPFFFKLNGQYSANSQVRGRDDFLSYDGGGVRYWGRANGRRDPQLGNLGANWTGAVGTSTGDAPMDYKYSTSMGGKRDLGNGWRVGGFTSLFYERDSSYHDNGRDDSYWVTSPGDGMTPKVSQGTVQSGDFKTSLFDITQASQSVQWGSLSTVGIETENNAISLLYLYTRKAEDKATLAEDTRGKAYYFPGYDPYNQNTPGHSETDSAPYLRLETLEYTERTTGTLQLNGRHTLPGGSFAGFDAPKLEWTVSHSTANSDQPDKRQFGSLWTPGRQVGPFTIPAAYQPYKPAANFTVGNLQRIYKSIEETSDQYSIDLELPFEQWSGDKGYLKFGLFRDRVKRDFDQDTFSNFSDNSSFEGNWNEPWSAAFPTEDHPITASDYDVDYRAQQRLAAWYGMLDLPVVNDVHVIGGARFEHTSINIVNDPEAGATWFPPGSLAPTQLNAGDADVDFGQHDVLPSIGLVYTPIEGVTVRASYNKTVARQTFKELTPILQQEYLGGPVFIGNPELQMSSLDNYDLRVDYAPYEGSLLSASWFRKDIDQPIEYVQRVANFDFTTAVNYPRGRLSGIELEARQGLGHWLPELEGLSLGANATFIHSKVDLPADEIAAFSSPAIQAPRTSRDMTNAPNHLYNLFASYDIASTGTQLSVYFNVQGDSLLAGAAEASGNFVPDVYARQYETLNLTLAQKLGKYISLQLAAKNITNPDIQTGYRSPYIDNDVTKTSYSRGVDYSIGIGGQITF